MRDIWDDGYSQSKKLTEEMVNDAEKKLGVKLPKDIVLLCGEGHWWVAFDYRDTKDNPPIIYMDLEWGTDMVIFELAPDFETLVNGLFIYEDEE